MLRIFLALSAAVWLPYGIFCFVQPSYLAEAAGVASLSPTGTTELRAMYGGLQVAIGSLLLAALVRPALVRPALFGLGFLTAGLGLARLGGALLVGALTPYTILALSFEAVSACLAFWLLARRAAVLEPT